jgi:hypothetical protein
MPIKYVKDETGPKVRVDPFQRLIQEHLLGTKRSNRHYGLFLLAYNSMNKEMNLPRAPTAVPKCSCTGVLETLINLFTGSCAFI